jgi:hypothetical protein
MAECLEQGVSRLVTEAIVDALEGVQVQVQDGAGRTVAQAGLALFLETAPVQYARQGIAQRIGHHLALVTLALGDVDERNREILADRLADNTQPAFAAARLVAGLETDRRLRVARIGEMRQQFLGLDLCELLQGHPDERARVIGKIRLSSTVREDATETTLGIIAIARESQDAVGRCLDECANEMLAIRQPA